MYSVDLGNYFIATGLGGAEIITADFDAANDLTYTVFYKGNKSEYILLTSAIIRDADKVIDPKTRQLTTFFPIEKPRQENAQSITVSGTIKKETFPISEDDYWYWFYFDEPFILKDNASGMPQTINKIQIVSPNDEMITPGTEIDLEQYINKHLKINTTLGWGLAESRIFILQNAIEL